ncbi:Gfo/Idh/MocA family protein [Sphingomonas carotinifaciens]|uniref:D-galactose 1-dehydrogenase n=1 Tax=Sphingomonas carotinifaciens TaxID=1166323 RepID=A0A1G7QCJ2_9SPHN|nr:Gfo/Idh/MocA family oxidoreductase [Sphingomonas carotinifaciens]MBB4087747.1 D-galactose 1-dehydrogenase [Sphingomonas carotinifaciens]MWC44888.1 gfo/Idh/MocA family oxidoreductase [Sphingomonas carotinifaciens]SDF96232.1 D-galactose 1-dehydrogenase [Sphingomonas carotinifaciens]
MTAPIRLALVGIGKIARDQHVPAIAANPDITLVACVSRSGETVDDLPSVPDLAALAASGIDVDAVALCTPPQVRYSAAAEAIANGWHVFLEKPPGATLAEVAALADAADAAGISLFASWHSRYAPGVAPARDWLAARTIGRVTITWREDVRVWHPGQAWIWEAGGFGVFDPGINALSIATHILPCPFLIERAVLDFPANRDAPIAARVDFRDTAGAPVAMDLDWRQEGPQSWDIVVETDQGTLRLAKGGAELTFPDGSTPMSHEGLHGEYPGLYARFAEIVQAGTSDVDVAPLRHVADAFLRGRRVTVEAFDE